ncbi:hypothetical protein like AT2G21110 [Hibiscus trionum]|uniref:Dirigent protein n=1 Tax=Hibiscus trionum TaxID=183268 RepID=A0A9W7MIW1_HIBTR|nr:hypothetical protein like AT2G21110 [Hibiscus trionum]
MEKSLISAWILVLTTAMAMAPCHSYYSKAKPYVPPPQKITRLHFFLHDTLSGENPSAVTSERDDHIGALRRGDSRRSTHSRPQHNVGGHWERSRPLGVDRSISMFSRNPITETEREVAVVGGSGKFRMAKGFAQLKTYFRNSTLRNSIVEYKVTVIHY